MGLALVSWAFARIGVHRPSLRFPYLMFSIRSYLPLDFNCVSSLRPAYRHAFGRPFTYSLLGEFPGLGLALVPDVVVPKAEQRCTWSRHGAENSIQISALVGVEPRTLASSGRGCATRLPRTPPFSRLLRHAGGYSRTILTPNLQG